MSREIRKEGFLITLRDIPQEEMSQRRRVAHSVPTVGLRQAEANGLADQSRICAGVVSGRAERI